MTQTVWLDRVDSTNEEATRRAMAGASDPLWIAARAQTAGRGRRGRAWDSADGNLFCTILLRPAADLAGCAQLAFAAGLAIAETADRFVHADRVRLKWPNDVLIDDRKIAGCLLETGQDAQGRYGQTPYAQGGYMEGRFLVIGIGLNLVSAPPDTSFPATHIAAHLRPGAPVPAPEAALDRLAAAFARWRDVWAGQGFEPLRAAFLARAARLGDSVHARLADGTERTGMFEDIDQTGALTLRDDKGARHAIAAADIFFPAAPGGTGGT